MLCFIHLVSISIYGVLVLSFNHKDLASFVFIVLLNFLLYQESQFVNFHSTSYAN